MRNGFSFRAALNVIVRSAVNCPPMQIDKPVWRSQQSCPCCEQGGLAFATCPHCGHTVLICEEVGSVFPARAELSSEPLGDLDDESLTCPSCHRVAVAQFRDTTVTELNQLGFEPGQYF
jgi:hypothetical protein